MINRTYYEDYKNKYQSYPVYPFDKLDFSYFRGIFTNLSSILCRRVPKSSLFLFHSDSVNIKQTPENDNVNIPLAEKEEKCIHEKEKDMFKVKNTNAEFISEQDIIFDMK